MEKVRTRYAPSPTGYLHAGQIRSALFNYLFTKQKGGVFAVRIEDTDRERSKKEYEDAIFEDLKWLGVQPDESPMHGGDFGPYRQSERTEIYTKYIKKLLGEEKAFYCFHTSEELDQEKKASGPSWVHRCSHKNLNAEEVGQNVSLGKSSVIRFDVSKISGRLSFHDLIRGEVSVDTEHVEDFSLARDLASPLYNFVVVVDDHEMHFSHIIRGEDHLSNTQKQLLLYTALDLEKPEAFAHLPLVLGKDRSKLSKRKGAKSIKQYREEGYLPEALINFMALLGWNPGDEREIFDKQELITEFSLDKVQKSGAVLDEKKLDWMNGEYIRKLSFDELYERAKSFLPEVHEKYPKEFILKILSLEQPRLKKLAELREGTEYFFSPPQYDKELLRWKKMTDEEIAVTLDKSVEILQKVISANSASNYEKLFLEEIGTGDKGTILWPLRVALSGKKASPGPFDLLSVFGQQESISRLREAKNKLTGNS